MPRVYYADNASSTLAVAVTATGQATLTVQTGHGARFPQPQSPDYFFVTLDDGTNVEICKCIDRVGDQLTVLRGQESTVAQASFAVGSRLALRWTKAGVQYAAHRTTRDTSFLKPSINTASWSWVGLRLPTVVGCVTAATLNNSSWRNTQPRIDYRTAQSAQNPIHWRVQDAICNIGNGFRYAQRFGLLQTPNSSHFFIGLINTTGAVTSVHPPSSLTQAIVAGWAGLGGNGAPPNLSIWRNDNAGNAVQTDLGSNFTVNSTAWFELEMVCVGNTAALEVIVRRLDVSSIVDARTVYTADIPTNSAWLSPMMNGATMVTSQIWAALGPVSVNN